MTNKTRVSYMDTISGAPYDVSLAIEFDIYQEAIDYVEKVARSLSASAGNETWNIYLLSYDNTSYRYLEIGGEVVKQTTSFPDPIG